MISSNLKKQNIRHVIVVLLLLMAAFAVSARVAYVHVEKSEFLRLEGERHFKRNIPLYAYRGDIVDRNGHELAVSAPAISIWADPDDLQEQLPELGELSRKIGVDYFALKRRIERSANRTFMYIKRQVSPEVADIVRQSGVGVFGVINERKRVYPEGNIFSQVIGITDIDNRGVEGVELAFNAHLQGKNGLRSVIRDRLGRSFEMLETLQPKVDGGDIRLSLDRNIQYIAFSELRRALQDHKATSGMLVVIDVKRAKVLAMVNYPTYNPNERSTLNNFSVRNRVITDVFEPGSALKPFVVAAALESGVVSQNDVFNVSPGYVDIAGKRVRDSKNYGSLDVAGVLSKSSNVGMVQIASKVDDDFLAEKLREYGVFSSPGIELPGESSGLFVPRPDWDKTYKDYLSFGYGAATSLLQLAGGYSVLANNGVRRDISVLEEDSRLPGVRVMDKRIALKVRDMLQGVVHTGGTGTAAATTAFSVSGKTGTAKKLKYGEYQDDAYTAVFCGMAPAVNPEIVIAIMVDDPKENGFYGGQVAAPVFSRVASRVLRYLDVQPDLMPAAILDFG